METPKPYRYWLLGLSLGVVLALLLWPATRWLVRTQLALALPAPSTPAPWGVLGLGNVPAQQQATHATAERHPNDYPLQLADALTTPPTGESLSADTKVARLRALTARFPDNPSLYANILRFAALSQVRIRREEGALLMGDPPADTTPGPGYNTPEKLAAFDRDAATGERLDPDNAYFPVLRAAGLFAAHRDADALDALRRAAQKPVWTEYYSDEMDGEWRLQEETYGNTGALPRAAQAFAILFPHYIQVRQAGRVAVMKAVEAEQAGRVEEGLAIRNTVRQCGSLLRAQSPSLIGAMIGISLTQTALMRPGGAQALRLAPISLRDPVSENHRSSMDTDRQRLRDFDAYLQRVGHPEASAAMHAEVDAGIQVRELVYQEINHEPFGTALPHLILWWLADLMLLSSVLWMLGLGGLAAMAGCHRRIRTGQGLPPYARRGILLGLLAAPSLLLSAMRPNTLMVDLTIAAFFGGVVIFFLPGLTRSDRLRCLGVAGFSLAGIGLLGSLLAWQILTSVQPLVLFLDAFTVNPEAHMAHSAAWQHFRLAGSIVTVPLLTLLALSVLSLVWRVPLSVGLARGFRGCAVPIACVLLLAYSILVPLTLRQDNLVDAGLKRTVQHEGRFIAELAGQEWPGPTH